jgi:small subunit ribosomal protein S1
MTEENKAVENTMEAQLEQFAPIKAGSIVTGKVVKVDDSTAFVDIGYKYDGQIPVRELSSLAVEKASDIIEVGTEVTCKVVSLNDAKEQLILSKRAIDGEKAWEQLQVKLENGEVIEVQVAEVVKGGLVVDLGVRGFVPSSMVERTFVEDFSGYKGKTLRVVVKEIDRENNKLILSQKDVLEKEFAAKKVQRLAEIKVNDVLTGTVLRLANFGAFVDLGGVDGLVHISELSWEHVKEASAVVSEGDVVTVKVIKIDPANDRISLSMKAVQPGPWELAQSTLKVGAILEGTVKRLTTFGAFVEIVAGVEGLVHISQISHNHIATPQEVLKENQVVTVKILDVNVAEQRISLSIKETEEAPVVEAKEKVDRPRRSKEDEVDPAFLKNEALAMTLGERFGDAFAKLSALAAEQPKEAKAPKKAAATKTKAATAAKEPKVAKEPKAKKAAAPKAEKTEATPKPKSTRAKKATEAE